MEVTENENSFGDPLFDVRGKVYLVAGAGGGLGRTIVHGLADRGASLVLLDVDEQSLEQVGSKYRDVRLHVADITDEKALGNVVGMTETSFGRLDGAINAAGLLPIANAEEVDEALFRQCVDTNLTGAFLFSRVASRAMHNGGRVIHIASVSSHVANPGYAAYASSKAGLSQLVRVLAREWAVRNILVNAIGPALIETPLTREYLAQPDFREAATSQIPLGRLGVPEDIVGPLLLLLGQGGAFITGQTIYVDGGRTVV